MTIALTVFCTAFFIACIALSAALVSIRRKNAGLAVSRDEASARALSLESQLNETRSRAESLAASETRLQEQVRTLIARLHENADFPHEIGLFLGYPPEDVDGFIRNGARCAKCVGPWKVYGDEQAARCKFAQYRKCTNVYRDCLKKYNSFDRLVVAVS